MILDLERLAYITSAGLRAILRLVRRLWARGVDIRICSLTATTREIFVIVGFTEILPIHVSRETALSAHGN